jgi:hypothetical protein
MTSVRKEPDSPARHSWLPSWREWAGDAAALVYIAFIATIAMVTGAFFVMFPELGALSQDIYTRPSGEWGSNLLLVAITPVLTGFVGIAVTNALPYSLLSVMLIVGASFLIIEVLHSPVAPAISAGLLPLVVDIHSWWYAPGIMLGCFLLALLSIPWKRLMATPGAVPAPPNSAPLTDKLERPPSRAYWLIPLLAFVAAATVLVELSGLRFILFPPLVVIGFEMFGHTDICPWANKPILLPLACFLTALGGFLFYHEFGFSPLTATLDMAFGILVLRALDLHVPPAFAVALLPLVMNHPTLVYPFSVGLGTLLLTLWFFVYRSWMLRHLRHPIAESVPAYGSENLQNQPGSTTS